MGCGVGISWRDTGETFYTFHTFLYSHVAYTLELEFFILLCVVWVLDGVWGGYIMEGHGGDLLHISHIFIFTRGLHIRVRVFHFIVRCVGFGWGVGWVYHGGTRGRPFTHFTHFYIHTWLTH